MANNKKKRKTSFGVLFWIAAILLFLVVFVATKPRIQEVVQSTGLLNVLQHRFGKDSATPPTGIETRNVVIGTDKNAPAVTSRPDTAPGKSGQPAPAGGAPAGGVANPPTETTFRSVPGLSGNGSGAADGSSAADGSNATTPASPSGVSTNKKPDTSQSSGSAGSRPAPPYHVRTAKLYYTFVTDDGRILPEAVERQVRYVDSPLTDTIRALLKGPTPDELNKGVLNLIPPKTQLISAYVQNGIAYLNFNEAFEFNTMGVEGFIAQLKEIVHTATEFSTVSRVQFLVNGKKVDYLGGEGIFIGRPLGRDSFS